MLTRTPETVARRGRRARVAGLVALTAAVTLIAAGCAVHDPSDPQTPGPGPLPSSAESASPGTETEAPGKDLEAVIVFASMDLDGAHASISAYVNGVVEDGGTCEFELTSAEKKVVSVKTTGAADRANTSCGIGQIPTTELSSGPWEARLIYTSVDAAGSSVTSAPETVEVP